jgi:mycothiol synthase
MPSRKHLFMLRPHLRGLPPPAPPPGVLLRPFRFGDESEWLDVVQAAYGGPWPVDTFDRCVRRDESFRPDRLFMALRAGRIVGVAGAFQKAIHGDATGYVHMMAVRPEEQRRGTGSALLCRCLERFCEEGRRNAALDTDASRLPAVRLYLGHGFLPFPETPEEMETWREVLAKLGRAEMAQRLRLCALPEGTEPG